MNEAEAEVDPLNGAGPGPHIVLGCQEFRIKNPENSENLSINLAL
jgi:hypothetical protein